MKTSFSQRKTVNLIAPSAKKKRSNNNSSRSEEQRSSPPKGPTKRRRRCGDDDFAKLNPSDNPVHANRIQQRRKAIEKGKNTAGYDCYRQQVPKAERRLLSMDTPTTPDPTLDIPAKRWLGQMRAWFVLLLCLHVGILCFVVVCARWATLYFFLLTKFSILWQAHCSSQVRPSGLCPAASLRGGRSDSSGSTGDSHHPVVQTRTTTRPGDDIVAML